MIYRMYKSLSDGTLVFLDHIRISNANYYKAIEEFNLRIPSDKRRGNKFYLVEIPDHSPRKMTVIVFFKFPEDAKDLEYVVSDRVLWDLYLILRSINLEFRVM